MRRLPTKGVRDGERQSSSVRDIAEQSGGARIPRKFHVHGLLASCGDPFPGTKKSRPDPAAPLEID
jgi:hypothetical protein